MPAPRSPRSLPDPLALLRELARAPRPAGGAEEARVRARCAGLLAASGFTVREEPFTYSAFPGRWGTPLAGAIAIATLLSGAWYGSHAQFGFALAKLIGGAVGIAIVGVLLGRYGVVALPFMRETSVNLVATRGSVSPTVWLVAHLDSKSQPVRMVVRIGGIVATSVVWLAMLATALARVASPELWWILGALGAVAAIPVLLATVGAESPGALDNASGVAAVLLAAGEISAERPVGVLLTSAEELGLAGARAWARVNPAPATVLNCDGLDDATKTVAMFAGARPARLTSAIRAASTRCEEPVEFRMLLPGVLVDAVALRAPGGEAVTFSRGGWRTLARIHGRGDSADVMTGEGIARVARLLTHTVEMLG